MRLRCRFGWHAWGPWVPVRVAWMDAGYTTDEQLTTCTAPACGRTKTTGSGW